MMDYPSVKRNPPPRPMVIPKSTKDLCACMKCHLVKTREQFIEDDCDNCKWFTPDDSMRVREEAVEKNTTTSFQGIVAMITPGKGWVSRWQGIPGLLFTSFCPPAFFVLIIFCCFLTGKYQPGSYALSVRGKMSDDTM